MSKLQLIRKKEASAEQELLQVRFKTVEEEQQIVLGEVYAPNMVDTDWEAMTPENVEKMAHNFLAKGYLDHIDVRHNLVSSGAKVVESFIVRNPNDPFFTEGAWVMGVWVPDDLWKQVKEGELNAFSFWGTSSKHPVRVAVEVVRSVVGTTEEAQDDAESMEKHSHTFVVRLDTKGLVVSGHTDFVQNHQHTISCTSATDREQSHSHRYFVE